MRQFFRLWDIPSNGEDSFKLGWLIRLRSMALLFVSALLLPGVYFGYLNWPSFVICGCLVLGLCLFNTLTLLFLRKSERVRPFDFLVQLQADLIILGSLLWLSGGFENPFWPVILFHAALGGFFLSSWYSYLFLIEVFVVLTILFYLATSTFPSETSSVIRAVEWISYSIVMLLMWLMTRWLTSNFNRQRTLSERLKSNRQKLDRLRAVGAVSAGLAHEIHTPLNTIRIRLERSKRNRPDCEDTKIALEALMQCEQSLAKLAGIEVSAEGMILQKINLHDFMSSVLETWRPHHSEVPIQLVSQSTQSPETEVAVLPLTQSILSILENSIEASKSPLPIRIVIQTLEKWVQCLVEDFGDGFSKIVLDRWGEPFLSTKPDGTGLGLYNAIQVVRALGGDIVAENRIDGGARLTISLPLCEPQTHGSKASSHHY